MATFSTWRQHDAVVSAFPDKQQVSNVNKKSVAFTGRATAGIAITQQAILMFSPHRDAKISNFFAPCPMLVKSAGFMPVIGLQKLLTFGSTRLEN